MKTLKTIISCFILLAGILAGINTADAQIGKLKSLAKSATTDKKCFFQKVYMKKDYLGGGKYGEVKYDESQEPSIGSCDIIK